MNGIPNIPAPYNEPVLGYAPGSPERASLHAAIRDVGGAVTEIPVVIDGCELHGDTTIRVTSPQRHQHHLATVQQATPAIVRAAIDGACQAQRDWENWSFTDRAAVFLRAADLLAGPWRARVNAATLLGQGKTPHQAEIDASCELIDFFRFNVHYAERLMHEQPISSPNAWNRLEHRALEGFIYAITPFNFTAIGGNLPTAPALLGNAVVWKPAATASLSNWFVYQILLEAGLPPGVIQFVPGNAAAISEVALDDPRLAGIHFTGSTGVFRSLWQGVGTRLDRYRSYPRIVGETGGKDFILAHASADVPALVTGLIRGAYEYQGQKCSAASRSYIPRSLWDQIKTELADTIGSIKMGDVSDFSNFMGAVIKQGAFDKHTQAIAEARETNGMKIVAGGGTDGREGWFVQPTLITTENPGVRHMSDEFFGPILTCHVYPDRAWSETLELVDRTSPYALTGAVFSRDRAAIMDAMTALRDAAGNFYINDKPTGAVVGQQPFGGARASGTDDKAGSPQNLLRFTAARTIKETFVSPTDYRYSFLDAP